MKIKPGQEVYFYSKWGQLPAVVLSTNPTEGSAMIKVQFAGIVHTKKAYEKNLKAKGGNDDKGA